MKRHERAKELRARGVGFGEIAAAMKISRSCAINLIKYQPSGREYIRVPQAVTLRKQGMSFQQIGNAMGISRQAANQLFHRSQEAT